MLCLQTVVGSNDTLCWVSDDTKGTYSISLDLAFCVSKPLRFDLILLYAQLHGTGRGCSMGTDRICLVFV